MRVSQKGVKTHIFAETFKATAGFAGGARTGGPAHSISSITAEGREGERGVTEGLRVCVCVEGTKC